MTAHKRGVLVFDLDGTLSDTSGDIAFVANAVRVRAGLPELPVPRILAMVGEGTKTLVSRLTSIPEGEPRHAELFDHYCELYAAHQGERSSLYPGVREALAALAPQFHLYVLSNKDSQAVSRELAVHGIERFFEAFWGGDTVPAHKPDPRGVALSLSRSGCPPERAAMIGDLVIDVRTGLNASVRTVHAAWGFGALGPTDPRPDAVAKSPEELEAIALSLFPRR